MAGDNQPRLALLVSRFKIMGMVTTKITDSLRLWFTFLDTVSLTTTLRSLRVLRNKINYLALNYRGYSRPTKEKLRNNARALVSNGVRWTYPRDIYLKCPTWPWDISRSCVTWPWASSRSCMGDPWNRPTTCSTCPWDISRACVTWPWDISRACALVWVIWLFFLFY